MYVITETVYHDEIIAEHINVRILPGRRAYVKTGDQAVFYTRAARIVIDYDFTGGEKHPVIRSDVGGEQ